MKKKHAVLLAAVLAFALLLGGAYVLYGRLSREVDSDQLSVQETPKGGETAAPSQPQESGGAEQPPEDTGGGTDGDRVKAPDFTVYDREKNAVHLSDFVGKPVVLNFWASWCGPCQSEMPDFNEAHAELGEDIHFLIVNVTTSSRESFEKASAFIDEKGYSFPVFYDLDGDAADTYGVYSLPTTYFIDAEGYGVAVATGAIDRDTLDRGIGMIAEQK